MVFTSYLWVISLHFCWILTAALDKFNEIQIHQLEGNVLRISCNITNGHSDSHPLAMSIFADTPNNTLVSVSKDKCPKVQGSAKDRHIYLPECVPQEGNHFLDMFLTNYNPGGNEQFGCNYTCMVDGQILYSLSHATVYSVDNTSHAASNETESAAALVRLPVTEGTTSSTKGEDNPIDVDGGTFERYGINIFACLGIACCILMMMMMIVLIVFLKRRRSVFSHWFDQAKKQTLGNSKDGEREALGVYREINKRNRQDNYDECTLVDVSVRDLPSVKDKEEYLDNNPYTTVVKVPKPETFNDLQ